MNFVTDTHALAWYFSEDERLSQKALAAFESTTESGQIIVPAVVLAEILFIARKGRLTLTFAETLKKITGLANFQIAPLDVNILTIAAEFDQGLEMHDLLIAATARYYNATLITADAQIQNAGLTPTLW
jgi:PIN domain nuclease of toxin-antitoxin system